MSRLSPQDVFIIDYRNLLDISSNPSDANILHACLIIRKFFLDKSPLCDTVNKTFRTQILFEVPVPYLQTDSFLSSIDNVISKAPSFASTFDAIDPETFPNCAREKIHRDRFFNLPISRYKGTTYPIKHIILYLANVGGGVHYDPSARKYAHLDSVSSEINLLISGMGIESRAILPVCRVVLRALEPLYNQIRV